MALLMRKIALVLMLLLLAAGGPVYAFAKDILVLHEQEIKAGLLYNFLKYVDWPAPPSGPVAVCIFGDDPFEGYLQPMAGRTVNQRTITVRKITNIQEAKDCYLVFVNAEEKARWPELKEYLDSKSILTVSDFQDFAQSGGMVEFGLKDNRIAVILNMEAISAARLNVQDRLLRLATVKRSASP